MPCGRTLIASRSFGKSKIFSLALLLLLFLLLLVRVWRTLSFLRSFSDEASTTAQRRRRFRRPPLHEMQICRRGRQKARRFLSRRTL